MRSPALVALAVVALTGCGGDGGSAGGRTGPAPSGLDRGWDVFDTRRESGVSSRPHLDLRAAGITVADGAMRLAARTAAPLRAGTFTFAIPAGDCGGRLLAIRVGAGGAATVRALDADRRRVRSVAGARATVEGTTLTATVPLDGDPAPGRSFVLWSADGQGRLADSVSRALPGEDQGCRHPEIRVIR